MDKMELKALGKINLGLDVLGRRENGYHDVRISRIVAMSFCEPRS